MSAFHPRKMPLNTSKNIQKPRPRTKDVYKRQAYHILNRAQNNVGLVLPGMQCVRDTMGGRWLYQNK